MTVESPTDLAGFFNDFASRAKITSAKTGVFYYLAGLFDNQYLSVNGGEIELNSSNPAFTVITADVINVRAGDGLDHANIGYKIRKIEDGGNGVTNLYLNRV